MELRSLGRTDLKVSSLSLGTMTFGEQNSEAEGHAQMDRAVDFGINFFDTAEIYAVPPRAQTQGSTERIIGTWLTARANRHKIVLATKIAGRSGMNWLRPGEKPTRIDKKQIDYAVTASLKRLQTDYIDLYQLHWPDRALQVFGGHAWRDYPDDYNSFGDILEALNDHVKKGNIRHIGLSNETCWGVMRFLEEARQHGWPRMASIQNAYNLVNRTFEYGLAEIASRESVGLLAYSPLAQGYLTGKYQGGKRPAGSRKVLFDRLGRYEGPGANAAIDAYLLAASDFGLKPEQLALRFVETRPFVTSVILGATSLAQLESDLASTHVTWNEEMEKRIDQIHAEHTNPCP